MKNEQDKGREQESIKEANIELEEYKRLAEERFDKLKYLQADFDNYRKKFDKEKESIIRLANENLIQELIVILDDFESSIRLTENDKNKEGSLLMKKKFFDLLQKHGLKEIESLGKKFDPNFHDVLCKELSEHDDDVVIEEIQKGYTLCSKVIRPTKVKISKKDNSQDLKGNELK
ncbi:MAG: nucleotide exchange factor GrpE [Nanoarchaeota archaeon]|nr:nucleotide exchange factor GrpE [Nanoarchaeota archaeon]